MQFQHRPPSQHQLKVQAKQQASAKNARLSNETIPIGPEGDRFEREADAVAHQVMGASPLTGTKQMGISAVGGHAPIQRLASHRSPSLGDAQVTGEQEQGEPEMQRKEKSGSNAASPTLSRSALHNAGGSGTSLPASTRNFMESRMGANFGNVRIHHGEQAAQYSDAVQARAFTYGRDIYFNRGEYQPETAEGQYLLAHELTHVMQQGGGKTADDRTPGSDDMKIQRMTAKGSLIRSGVAPWGGTSPIGADFNAQTDAGSTVTVWVGGMAFIDRLRYWCHGHSLDTYNRFDYSVYSRTSMQTVINDEYTNVPPANAQAGDLAVWTNGWDHSARITTPVVNGGALDPNATTLSTKNGQGALANMSLTAIMAVYGPNGVGIYRHV